MHRNGLFYITLNILRQSRSVWMRRNERFFQSNYIFSKDMRLGKYTLEHRNLGQAEGAHKVGASERCSQNPAARVWGP